MILIDYSLPFVRGDARELMHQTCLETVKELFLIFTLLSRHTLITRRRVVVLDQLLTPRHFFPREASLNSGPDLNFPNLQDGGVVGDNVEHVIGHDRRTRRGRRTVQATREVRGKERPRRTTRHGEGSVLSMDVAQDQVLVQGLVGLGHEPLERSRHPHRAELDGAVVGDHEDNLVSLVGHALDGRPSTWTSTT